MLPSPGALSRCGANIGARRRLIQRERGFFPTPAQERLASCENGESQEEPESSQEEHAASDLSRARSPRQGEQEGVLDDGVARAEKQSEAVQLFRSDLLIL